MTFLKTILTSTLVCAALLLSAAYYVDVPAEPVPYAGLTAVAILGTDNQAADRRSVSDQPLDTLALGRLIGEAARGGREP